jgi:hypothetical protein
LLRRYAPRNDDGGAGRFKFFVVLTVDSGGQVFGRERNGEGGLRAETGSVVDVTQERDLGNEMTILRIMLRRPRSEADPWLERHLGMSVASWVR